MAKAATQREEGDPGKRCPQPGCESHGHHTHLSLGLIGRGVEGTILYSLFSPGACLLKLFLYVFMFWGLCGLFCNLV